MFWDIAPIMAYTFGIIFIYVIFLFFLKPLKVLFKLLVNFAFGGVMIYVINLVGGILGVKIGINLFTSAISGFMGIPGVIMLYAFEILL